MSDGLVVNNPAAALRIPKTCQPGRDLRSLAEEEVNTYLEVFDRREKLISRLAICEGMRPGEIVAIRWKSVKQPFTLRGAPQSDRRQLRAGLE